MNRLKQKYLEKKLIKAHFKLIRKTLLFIKINHEKFIYKKEDPELFADLLEKYSLEQTLQNFEMLEKIINKIKTRGYIDNYPVNSELLHLLTLPYRYRGYFTNFHMETLNESIRPILSKYFKFIEKDLSIYFFTSSQILDTMDLFSPSQKKLAKKIKSLKFGSNTCLWHLRKSIVAEVITHKISLEAKHIFLTIQVLLVKKTLEAETYAEIYFFRNLLTDFLFFSKLVT